jgi:hypothetical protein
MLVIAVGIALAATPAASAAGKKATLKLKSDSQSKILRKGVKVKVKGLKQGKIKIKAKSSTFDQQKQLRFAKAKKLKASKLKGKKKTVRLRLTGKGKKRIATCQGRKMVISAKHAGQVKAKLVRDTEACAPKPIDLSRAADCDFIGAQEGSLCLMPFPDGPASGWTCTTPACRRTSVGRRSPRRRTT